MRMLLGLAAFLVLAYALVILGLYAGQRRILFPASSLQAKAAEAGLAGFRDVVIATSDGERLIAWWKAPEPGRALVLYFHGNGGSLLNRRDRARALSEGGRGLLLVSYRGYSGSTGSPSEEGLRRDAEAAYAFLASYDPARIVLYGESLGSAVAIRLATDHPVAGLVLDAPFTSVVDVARPLFRFAPVDLLMRDRFASAERIAAVRAPILVLHGDRDAVVPIALGEALFAAAPEPKRFVRLPGVDHVSVLEQGGLAPVEAFLSEVESRDAAPK